MNSIDKVYKKGLCCNCGTCVSVCPHNNIQLKRDSKGYKLIKKDLCTNCRLCLRVCPSVNKLPRLEPIKCFYGYSKNESVRFNSSSGGIITQLLIGLLKSKKISGAIVCDFEKENPFSPKGFIVDSKDALIKASRSKYCPVPLNEVIKKLKNKKGKFVFVGLPCHIKGLRLYEKLNKKLKDKILVRIGLFCNHTPNFQATEFILCNLGIKKDEVKCIKYRGEGCPGKMQIIKKNRKIIKVNRLWSTGFGKYFIPNACLECNDTFANYADISVGDAWFKEFEHEKKGISCLICRSESAIKLLEQSKNIYLQNISFSKIFDVHKQLYELKINNKKRIIRKINSFLGKWKLIWRILYLKETRNNGIIENENKKNI